MIKNTLSVSEGSQPGWSVYNASVKFSLPKQSALFGGILGEVAGAILGTATGALTMDLTGILLGFTAGIIIGAVSGTLIGLIVSRLAGISGGAGVGAYAGMGIGAVLGMMFGLMIPESVRLSANTMNIPVLNALTSSRFETVSLFAFLVCILGTLVGVWVGGRNYRPRAIR